MSDRAIHWSITINNPTSSDDENLATAKGKGWVVEGQKECGKDGTPHYQLYVNTRSQQRFSALKKVFKRAHIEVCRNPKATQLYVGKQETRVADLPNSDRYITSQKRLWELVADELTSGECDKKYRIDGASGEPFSGAFRPLDALDYACDRIIRQGFHCVESMAVNPQVRGGFAKFWGAIIDRRERDRQTDRQTALDEEEQSVTIETNADDNEEQDGSDEEGGLCEAGGEEDSQDSSEGEGSDDGEGSDEDSQSSSGSED